MFTRWDGPCGRSIGAGLRLRRIFVRWLGPCVPMAPDKPNVLFIAVDDLKRGFTNHGRAFPGRLISFFRAMFLPACHVTLFVQ